MNLVPIDEFHFMVKEQLESDMREQGHHVPDITHVMQMDNGDMVGAIDATWMPALFLWMDERRWSPVAAYKAWRLIVDHWRESGHDKMMIAIQPESPFYPWAFEAGADHLATCEFLSLNLNPKKQCVTHADRT